MTYDLEGKIFSSIANSITGEVSDKTRFCYHQQGLRVWAEYQGGSIVQGHLLAKVLDDGRLDMRYHHLNTEGELKIGQCLSTPSRTADGRLKFHEEWQWLSGDRSKGSSEIVEVISPGDSL